MKQPNPTFLENDFGSVGHVVLVNALVFILYIVQSNQDSLGYSDSLRALFVNIAITLQCPDCGADLCFDHDVPLGADHPHVLYGWFGIIAAGLLVMFILAYDADSEEFNKIGDYWVYATWSIGPGVVCCWCEPTSTIAAMRTTHYETLPLRQVSSFSRSWALERCDGRSSFSQFPLLTEA